MLLAYCFAGLLGVGNADRRVFLKFHEYELEPLHGMLLPDVRTLFFPWAGLSLRTRRGHPGRWRCFLTVPEKLMPMIGVKERK